MSVHQYTEHSSNALIPISSSSNECEENYLSYHYLPQMLSIGFLGKTENLGTLKQSLKSLRYIPTGGQSELRMRPATLMLAIHQICHRKHTHTLATHVDTQVSSDWTGTTWLYYHAQAYRGGAYPILCFHGCRFTAHSNTPGLIWHVLNGITDWPLPSLDIGQLPVLSHSALLQLTSDRQLSVILLTYSSVTPSKLAQS